MRASQTSTRPLALAAFLALLACGPTLGSPPDTRPNLVLITIEALRADRLGSYGFPLDTTPVLDAVAASGVRFERAIAAANRAPSALRSIHTSSFSRDRATDEVEGASGESAIETLSERLRNAGYTTAAFVTGPSLGEPIGLERGFDRYEVVAAAPSSPGRPPGVSAPDATRDAIAWLDASGPEPFFLWIHYRDPHGPYTPLPADKGRFRVKPAGDAEPLAVLADETGLGGIPASQALPRVRYPTEYESRQADEIHATDRQVGRLLDSVDAHASGRAAVVLVTGVFGESLGENDRWFVHEHATSPEVAHVPLLLRAPNLAPANRAETAHHVDIAPTLLEAAGLASPESARGLALAPRLRGELPFPERKVYCDMETELSAYDATGFTRATGLGSSGDPQWTRWAWHPEMSPIRLPDPVQIETELRDYANRPTSISRP
jgi:arylsulfatase A-like enzyme